MVEIIHRPIVSQNTRLLENPVSNRKDLSAHAQPGIGVHSHMHGGANPHPSDPRAAEVAATIEKLRKELATEKSLHAEAVRRAELAGQRLADVDARLTEELERAQREGYEQGYAKGAADGVRDAEQRTSEQVRALLDVCRAAQKQFGARLEQCVEDAGVEVIYAAVVKILGDCAPDPDAVAAIARQLCSEVRDGQAVRVRVSPQVYELLKADSARARKRRSTLRAEFLPDERVELGGCVVESPTGELDGRLEIQLRRLKDVLLEARGNRPDSEERTS